MIDGIYKNPNVYYLKDLDIYSLMWMQHTGEWVINADKGIITCVIQTPVLQSRYNKRKAIMKYEDWAVDQEVKYTLTVEVNDEEVIEWEYYSLDSLQSEMGKVERVVEKELQEQYNDEVAAKIDEAKDEA